MGVSTTTMTSWKCDAPGCDGNWGCGRSGVAAMHVPHPNSGTRITMVEFAEDGGAHVIHDVWACRERCLRALVERYAEQLSDD